MKIFIELFIKALAVFVTAYILSAGITVPTIWMSIVVAIVLGVLNTFLKPLLLLLTLPVNILSLGIFTFFVNAFIVMLASWIIPGFVVVSFWWAMLFSVILCVVSMFLNLLVD